MKVSVDNEVCTGCGLCVKDCPANAIKITKLADKKFECEIELDHCIYCAQCVASCKEDALAMSSELYHLASTDRASFTEVYRAGADGACVDADEGR